MNVYVFSKPSNRDILKATIKARKSNTLTDDTLTKEFVHEKEDLVKAEEP